MANYILEAGAIIEGTPENYAARKAIIEAHEDCTIEADLVGDNQWLIIVDYAGDPADYGESVQ